MGKVRVGVIGCGDVAQQAYIPGISSLDRQGCLEFAAVADLAEGRAAKLAERYGVPRAFTDHNELLKCDIDVVVNLTPMQVHAKVTLDSIAAGKHVYTEKPLATSMEDADAVIEAASSAGVKVGVAPALLVHPDVQQSLRWIHDGVIGKVCLVRARASHPGPDRLADFLTDPSWFYRSGGGPLFDLGIYPLHVITAALGPAKRVSAFSGIALPDRVVKYGEAAGKGIEVEVDDNTQLTLDFGGATFANIDASYCVLSSKGPRMEFYGETGVMNLASEAEDPPIEVFRLDEGKGPRGWLTPEKVYRGRVGPPTKAADPHPYNLVAGLEHMVEHLKSGAPFLLTPEHARHVLEIMLAAQRSADRGKVLDLDTTFERPALGAVRDPTEASDERTHGIRFGKSQENVSRPDFRRG